MVNRPEINAALASTVRPPVTIPVIGSERGFNVRRIYCVGRNYNAHIQEMGGNERQPPFFFQKPTDAIVMSGKSVAFPMQTEDFQHEIELVLAIGGAGRNISIEQAGNFILGAAVGVDLTRRDLQLQARNSGRPWESGKSFDESAGISPIQLLAGPAPNTGAIELRVNGELRQTGNLEQMIWKCEEIIAQLSKLFELKAGDLIFTGTPAGVGKLRPGDILLGVNRERGIVAFDGGLASGLSCESRSRVANPRRPLPGHGAVYCAASPPTGLPSIVTFTKPRRVHRSAADSR